jgi:hypothetical protein
LEGKLTLRGVARRCRVSFATVSVLAHLLGIADTDRQPQIRRAKRRCTGCGRPLTRRQRCIVCEHERTLAVAAQRREFQRQLAEDPLPILRRYEAYLLARKRASQYQENAPPKPSGRVK